MIVWEFLLLFEFQPQSLPLPFHHQICIAPTTTHEELYRVDIEHFPAESSSGVRIFPGIFIPGKYRLVLIAIARRAEIITSRVDDDPIDIRFEKGAAKAIHCRKGWGCRGGVKHSMMCVLRNFSASDKELAIYFFLSIRRGDRNRIAPFAHRRSRQKCLENLDSQRVRNQLDRRKEGSYRGMGHQEIGCSKVNTLLLYSLWRNNLIACRQPAKPDPSKMLVVRTWGGGAQHSPSAVFKPPKSIPAPFLF
ncbi:hypothetical protein CDAR_216001 [Caerostris darwini]|uniref:Uncharacterized protein n=1 Tax=Caerostris darwini TaxID=1538125 RepID=A0AAV4NJU5_9ARAC|nr:hypothetical protein CDAR_216001 [Caerostris darwini]